MKCACTHTHTHTHTHIYSKIENSLLEKEKTHMSYNTKKWLVRKSINKMQFNEYWKIAKYVCSANLETK